MSVQTVSVTFNLDLMELVPVRFSRYFPVNTGSVFCQVQVLASYINYRKQEIGVTIRFRFLFGGIITYFSLKIYHPEFTLKQPGCCWKNGLCCSVLFQ